MRIARERPGGLSRAHTARPAAAGLGLLAAGAASVEVVGRGGGTGTTGKSECGNPRVWVSEAEMLRDTGRRYGN